MLLTRDFIDKILNDYNIKICFSDTHELMFNANDQILYIPLYIGPIFILHELGHYIAHLDYHDYDNYGLPTFSEGIGSGKGKGWPAVYLYYKECLAVFTTKLLVRNYGFDYENEYSDRERTADIICDRDLYEAYLECISINITEKDVPASSDKIDFIYKIIEMLNKNLNYLIISQ